MPKIGMKPIRRKALIDATIAEIGQAGSLDVTVGQIAKRAGMSSGLAHHYFGGKEQMLLAAMRQILTNLQVRVRANLRHPNAQYFHEHLIGPTRCFQIGVLPHRRACLYPDRLLRHPINQ